MPGDVAGLILRDANGDPIPVEIRRSRRRKATITLRVTADKVFVLAPEQSSDTALRDLLERRRRWIVRTWTELQRAKAAADIPQPLCLGGQPIPVHHVETPGTTWKFCYESSCVTVIGPHPASRPAAFQTALVAWIKHLARRVIAERTAHWARRLGYRYNAIRIRDQKTRWGSCSRQGNLNFNWKLVMAPVEVMDYVIVHELCHLAEFNHSPRFWRLVASALPEYAASRRWLRQYGHQLQPPRRLLITPYADRHGHGQAGLCQTSDTSPQDSF